MQPVEPQCQMGRTQVANLPETCTALPPFWKIPSNSNRNYYGGSLSDLKKVSDMYSFAPFSENT